MAGLPQTGPQSSPLGLNHIAQQVIIMFKLNENENRKLNER